MKDRIDWLIDYVARTESGGRYDAWNPDDNGAGVSFGLIQFNQRKGSLPTLMQRMHDADPDHFLWLAGPLEESLLDEVWVRSEDLNVPSHKARILTLLRDPAFHQVQRDLVREGYFLPAWEIGQRHGLTSERAAAMCFDIAVQRGVGFLRKALKKTLGYLLEKNALHALAASADEGLGGHDGRRHKILHDPALSDEPFDPTAPAKDEPAPRTLRRGDSGSEVLALTQQLVTLRLMSFPSSRFGPRTEAAVREFQWQHGLSVDGIAGPRTQAAIRAALAIRKDTTP